MMRIAIAGSGGLAQHFAHFINETPHPFIILSRSAKPNLEALGYQVVVVDYDDIKGSLQYALKGTDLVISTVLGSPQINLIDAASRVGVRRFVPAEFEGPPTGRPAPAQDPFDRGRASALDFLLDISKRKVRRPMKFTVFTCGIFYERFALGGLASKGIGLGTGLEHQGAYLIDIQRRTAEIIENNSSGQPVYLCMTSVTDLAKFVVAALNLNINDWPAEYQMRGDRRAVAEIVNYAQAVTNTQFTIINLKPEQLIAQLQHAQSYQDHARTARLQALVATANRQYDYSNNDVLNIQLVTLWNWMWERWGPAEPAQQ